MSKPYYVDYVNHALRFYCRNTDPEMIHQFRTASEEKNWHSCRKVVEKLDVKKRELILRVYRTPATSLPEAVYSVQREMHLSLDYIWKVIGEVSYRVAKTRGIA